MDSAAVMSWYSSVSDLAFLPSAIGSGVLVGVLLGVALDVLGLVFRSARS